MKTNLRSKEVTLLTLEEPLVSASNPYFGVNLVEKLTGKKFDIDADFGIGRGSQVAYIPDSCVDPDDDRIHFGLVVNINTNIREALVSVAGSFNIYPLDNLIKLF